MNINDFPEVPTHQVDILSVIPPVRVPISRTRVILEDDSYDNINNKRQKIIKGGRPKFLNTIVKELIKLADDAISSKSMDANTMEEFIKSKVPNNLGMCIFIIVYFLIVELADKVLDIIQNLNEVISSSHSAKAQEKLDSISFEMESMEGETGINIKSFIKDAEDCTDIESLLAADRVLTLQSQYIKTLMIRDENNSHKYVLEIVRKIAKNIL